MKKSSSSNSFVDQASDVDDHPSLMDMYARQLGVAAEKGGRDIPSGSPPPPDTSNNQQDEGQQQPTVYHDDPSERQVEPAVVGVSDKTGFISQNDTGNKHKGSNRFFSSLSKVASSAKSMVGKIAASSSSSSAASAYFNPNAQISLANLSGKFLLAIQIITPFLCFTLLHFVCNIDGFRRATQHNQAVGCTKY